MNLTTKLHYYHFDFTYPEQHQAYLELKANMKANGVKPLAVDMPNVFSQTFKDYWDKVRQRAEQPSITLDTTFVFEDQWNEAGDGGLRLMDWEDVQCPNPNIHYGYWLELTDEMLAAREHTHICGYCGHRMDDRAGLVPEFCPKCLGHETLKPESLHLTRMRPVAAKGPRMPLTEAERLHLLPLYRQARIEGHTKVDKERLAKARARIVDHHDATVEHATRERDGKLWLLDHGVALDNAIYYPSRNTFSFGWRQPISTLVLEDLVGELAEFPFNHEIVCSDGTTIQFPREE